MTIAACYLSGEGVVFGADSTTTMYVAGIGPGASGAEHHYNFAQKIFQVGEGSTLALTMWGLGNLRNISYRTLIAQFADSLVGQGAQSMLEVANRWSQFFWSAYSTDHAPAIQRAQHLCKQSTRNPEEEEELFFLRQMLSGGFCVGGYLMNDRTPAAYEIRYDPTMTGPAEADELRMGSTRFWGCPNLINRLLFGIDDGLLLQLSQSKKWLGTNQELIELVRPYCLG